MRPYFALVLGMMVLSVEARDWGFSKDTVFQSYYKYLGDGAYEPVIDTFYIENSSSQEISLDSGKLEIVKPSNSTCNFSLQFGIEPRISVLPLETHKSGFLEHSYDSLKILANSRMMLGRSDFYANGNGPCPIDSFLLRAIVYSGESSDTVLVKAKWENNVLANNKIPSKRKFQKTHSNKIKRNTLGRSINNH